MAAQGTAREAVAIRHTTNHRRGYLPHAKENQP